MGGSKAIWNFSENPSALVWPPVPKAVNAMSDCFNYNDKCAALMFFLPDENA